MMPRLRIRRPAVAPLRAHRALIVVALALTACGPTPPFELAVHEVPGDVVYGGQSTPAPSASAGSGPSALAPGAPPLIYGAPAPPPQATFASIPATTPAPVCPAAPVDAVPALQADPWASVPPVATAYLWRTDVAQSWYTLGGGPKLAFPATFTHTVANVSPADATTGAYTFDVATSAGGVTGLQKVTDSFEVIPPPEGTSDVQGVSTSQAAGLYLTAMQTLDPSDPRSRVTRFAPPILLMQFPGNELPTWNTAGTDTATGTTIQLAGAVLGHVSVDACGTVIDAWQVHATGSLVGPNQNLSLDLTYDVATQYGGIIVAEQDGIGGTELSGSAMQSVGSHDVSFIAVPPQRRAG